MRTGKRLGFGRSAGRKDVEEGPCSQSQEMGLKPKVDDGAERLLDIRAGAYGIKLT